MKQSIKIGLIAFTAIAIAVLLFYFTKKIDNAEVEKITPQSFVNYVEQRTNDEIADKPYEEAKNPFYQLMGEINTESFVWVSDSTKALTEREVAKCKQMAFYAYAPIFSSYGIAYFERQSWTMNEAVAIRDEAKLMLSYNIAENDTQLKADLDQIVKNVKDYHMALVVINNAGSCSSVEEVSNTIANAKKYKHAPLTNNKKLVADLNNVPNVAKEGLAERIVGRVNGIIARKCNYSEYSRWYEAKEQSVNAIEEYEDAFGKVTKLTDAKKRLEQADEEALDCYD